MDKLERYEIAVSNGGTVSADGWSGYYRRLAMRDAGKLPEGENVYGIAQAREHVAELRATKGEYAKYWATVGLAIQRVTTTIEVEGEFNQPKLYLVRVRGDVEPEIVEGPFTNDDARLEAARAIRSETDEDGIFMLDIDAQGKPSMFPFAGGDFEDDEEPPDVDDSVKHALYDALKPFAELLSGEDLSPVGGGTVLAPDIKVQMIKDAQAAIALADNNIIAPSYPPLDLPLRFNDYPVLDGVRDIFFVFDTNNKTVANFTTAKVARWFVATANADASFTRSIGISPDVDIDKRTAALSPFREGVLFALNSLGYSDATALALMDVNETILVDYERRKFSPTATANVLLKESKPALRRRHRETQSGQRMGTSGAGADHCNKCDVQFTEEDINGECCTNCGATIGAFIRVAPFAILLKKRFPWLGMDDDAGSGADVIGELSDLYESLVGVASPPLDSKAPKNLNCPNCGERPKRLRVIADTIVESQVIAYGNGKIKAQGQANSYENEESESNDRLDCSSCGHEFPIPPNVTVEYV